MTLTWTHSALKPRGAKNCLDILKKNCAHKSKLWQCFLSPSAIVTVAIWQQATVKLPSIIAQEKCLKFHAQLQTRTYSCFAYPESSSIGGFDCNLVKQKLAGGSTVVIRSISPPSGLEEKHPLNLETRKSFLTKRKKPTTRGCAVLEEINGWLMTVAPNTQ